MCVKLCKNKKKKKREGQTLSYPLAIRSQCNSKIIKTLQYLQGVTRKYLRKFYQKDGLEALADSSKKAYKQLEPLLPVNWKKRIPSRINRGVLEIAGRNLRAIGNRKELFEVLVRTCGENPRYWNYQKLISTQGLYIKSQYIKNLGEQTENFFEEFGTYPKDFFQLQQCPKLKKPMVSYAPDDGQAIRIEKKVDHLLLQIKVKSAEGWEWIEVKVPLPPFLRELEPAAPDLRVVNIHGQRLPVLDYKVVLPFPKKHAGPYFLTVDWGTRKLVTIGVFDKEGNQIAPPIFLKFEKLQEKLLRLRREIDRLKSLRDTLPRNSTLWLKYNREIAKRWRKFRAIQDQLSHLAANVIVLVAQIYQCSAIYVEWLKSLKSQHFSPTLNWTINTTVREAIYEKVAYKAKLLGMELKRPVHPYGTSQYCPRCGKKGIHTRSPNHYEKVKSGGWFRCPSCGYNADRDYVACCNLARKVLYGNLRDLSKGIAYMARPTPDPLFRQGSSLPRERLRRNLHGWKEVITLTPQKFFCGTLRL